MIAFMADRILRLINALPQNSPLVNNFSSEALQFFPRWVHMDTVNSWRRPTYPPHRGVT
jgi:hypothetical protein